jgi:AcrR family transcriptional regulator
MLRIPDRWDMGTRVGYKRKDGIRRQAQIMEIALSIFADKGYHATSVDDIIEAAGIARGTFYLHFKGKRDILDRMIDNYLSSFYTQITPLDISMDKPAEVIKKMYLDIAGVLMKMKEVRLFTRLMLREVVGLDRLFLEKMERFFDDVIVMSAGYIKKAQDEGKVITSIDAMSTSLCIVGAVKEILYHWAVLQKDIDMEKAISSAVDLFFRGMMV